MSKVQYSVVSKAFREYLEQLAQNNPNKYKNLSEASDVSLFSSYSNDFKNFVKDEYSVDSFDDINLSLENLKLHINDQGVIENANGGSEDDDMILGILNGLMKDEDFISTIDTDGVEGISDDEINAFFDAIKNYGDKDETSVSLSDLISASNDIKENKFDKNILTAKPTTTPAGSTSPTGSTGTTPPTDTPGTTPPTDTPVSYDGMSTSELESKRSEQQGLLKEYSNFMRNINEYEQVKPLKEDLDKKQQAYQEVLTKTLGEEKAKEIQECITEYAKAEQATIDGYAKEIETTAQIKELEGSINASEGNIQGYNASKTANLSTISSLEAKIENLKAQQSDPNADPAIGMQISQLEGQTKQLQDENVRLDSLIEQEEKAKEENQNKLNSANEELQNIQKEIEANEKAKTDWQTKQAKLESELTQEQQAAIQTAKDEYNAAQKAYTDMINFAKQYIGNEFNTAKKALEDINKAINAAKAKEAEEKSKTTAKENDDGTVTLTFPKKDTPPSSGSGGGQTTSALGTTLQNFWNGIVTGISAVFGGKDEPEDS